MKSSGNLLEPSQNQVLVKTLPSISQTFGSEARVQDLTGEVASLL